MGAVLFDVGAGRAEAFGLTPPASLSEALVRDTGSDQVIAQLELLPVLLALRRWPAAFRNAGRRCLVFIDNDSARHALIKGFSPVRASRLIVEATWAELALLQAAAWFTRVCTDGNCADGPSRLQFDALRALPMPAVRVDPPACAAGLRSLARGGGESAGRPAPGPHGRGG